MYSESEIDDAVRAGALTPEAAAALRDHVARRRAAPAADEEHFRLITGFNDIFVVAAAALVLIAVGWIGAKLHGALGGAGVGLASWALAEYFTRRRRMALPSIVFLLTFAGGAFWCAARLLSDGVGAGLCRGGAGVVRRLIGAGRSDRCGCRRPALVALSRADNGGGRHRGARRLRCSACFSAGRTIPCRSSCRSCSSRESASSPSPCAGTCPTRPARPGGPMSHSGCICWPRRSWCIRSSRLPGPAVPSPALSAAIVLALYAAVGVVALAIDRRALLVSALVYLLAAVYDLFRDFDDLSLRFAAAALIVGAALLLLSAFWRDARALVVHRLPDALRSRLPAASA